MTCSASAMIKPEKDEGSALSPLNRTPLLDSTVDALRKAILNAEIEPGERLDEVTLTTRLGVSRTTIREAMRQLEQEGLLVRIPFRGTFAREFTHREIQEINSLRGVLEAYAVEIIIESGKHSLEDLSLLYEIVQQIEKTFAEKETERTIDLHIAFHRILLDMAGNSLLSSIWTILAQQFLVALRLSQLWHLASGEGSTLAQAHREIADAIAAGDTEQAQRVIRQHVSDSGLTLAQFPRIEQS